MKRRKSITILIIIISHQTVIHTHTDLNHGNSYMKSYKRVGGKALSTIMYLIISIINKSMLIIQICC